MLRLEELKTMEIESFSSSSNVTVLNKMFYSVMESVVLETVLVAGKSLFCFLLLAGSMNIDVATALPRVPVPDERISLVGYQKVKRSDPEKDASDTEDDEEEDDDDAAGDEEDDAGDEDFSGEEENEDDDEDDPEAAKANGVGGSDDEDDDEDEDDEDEDGEDEDEEEEDEDDEDEETPQPPAKKRK